ncbi:MAG: site-specific integrase [bacterium]
MPIELLKLVDGAPGLTGTGHIPLSEAITLSGITQSQLLRAAAERRLSLFCRLGAVPGYLIPESALELQHPALGRTGGFVVPQTEKMHSAAVAILMDGVLQICGSDDLASAVLADGLTSVQVVLFEDIQRPGWFLAPDAIVSRDIDKLEVRADAVDAIRRQMATTVLPERVERARELERAAGVVVTGVKGSKPGMLFSAAVEAYAKEATGLPKDLTSEAEQRHQKKGILLFAEFMGDLQLGEIDADKLRAFRDGPLRTLPAKANNLPKKLRRASMKETIAAIKAADVECAVMSRSMQHERMLWLFRFFRWVAGHHGWLEVDPSAALRGETGLTKAERKEIKRHIDPDNEGRASFGDDDLEAIFSQSWFKVGSGLHIKKPSYWYPFEYWLPLLGLFAGCRIKEAAQLHLSDVKQVGAIWCLDINENTRDKSLKNDQSKRQVPLHQKLIALGFLEYCAALREQGFRRVFPELTWAKTDAKYAKEPIRKMSEMLGRLGMPRDSTHVFHCTRHNFNNALARVPLSSLPFADEVLKKFIRYTVLGHKPGDDVNVAHYTHTSAIEMAALVSAVDYKLPVIAKFDIEFAVAQISLSLTKKCGSRRGKEDLGPLNDD